jgi:hypothetical protein
MRVYTTLWLTGLMSLSAAEPPRNTSAIGQLKDGPGKAMVQANCIPCHSTAIVAANHLSREEWDETITIMQKKNGMWPLPPVIRKMILDYLEIAQRPEDRGLNQGKSTAWAEPLYRPNPLWE